MAVGALEARWHAVTVRLLGNASLAVVLALLLTVGLSGCDDDADRAAVDDVVAAADAALDGVLHQVADTLVLSGAEGNRSFTVCGDDLAPRGVVMNDFVRFDSSGDLGQEEATAAAVGLLDDDGWTVERADNPGIVTATKDGLVMRVEITASLVQVHLRADCIETPRDLAEEYADRSTVDLDWS